MKSVALTTPSQSEPPTPFQSPFKWSSSGKSEQGGSIDSFTYRRSPSPSRLLLSGRFLGRVSKEAALFVVKAVMVPVQGGTLNPRKGPVSHGGTAAPVLGEHCPSKPLGPSQDNRSTIVTYRKKEVSFNLHTYQVTYGNPTLKNFLKIGHPGFVLQIFSGAPPHGNLHSFYIHSPIKKLKHQTVSLLLIPCSGVSKLTDGSYIRLRHPLD